MAELENVENSRSKLNPVHAKFFQNVEAVSVPLTDTKEVRVLWGYSTEQEYSELENFLQAYTWPTNIGPKRYVKDPIIAGEKLKGTWRQAFISRIPQDTQSGTSDMWIALTLRKGWAESLNWDEARFIGMRDSKGSVITDSDDPNQKLDIVLPNVDPTKAYSIIEALGDNIAFGTSTRLLNGTITGTWYRSLAIPVEQADGSSTITITLSQEAFAVSTSSFQGTPDASARIQYWRVPKDQVATIVGKYTDDGDSVSAALSRSEELVDISIDRDASSEITIGGSPNYIWSDRTFRLWQSRTYYFGFAEPQSVPDPVQGHGYQATSRINTRTGKWSSTVTDTWKQTQQALGDVDGTVGGKRTTSVTAHAEVDRKEYLGVYPDEVTGALVFKDHDGNVVAVPNLDTLTASGSSYAMTRTLREDNTEDVVYQKTLPIAQLSTVSWSNQYGACYSVWYMNQPAAIAPSTYNPGSGTLSGVFYNFSVSHRINAEGLYDGTLGAIAIKDTSSGSPVADMIWHSLRVNAVELEERESRQIFDAAVKGKVFKLCSRKYTIYTASIAVTTLQGAGSHIADWRAAMPTGIPTDVQMLRAPYITSRTNLFNQRVFFVDAVYRKTTSNWAVVGI